MCGTVLFCFRELGLKLVYSHFLCTNAALNLVKVVIAIDDSAVAQLV